MDPKSGRKPWSRSELIVVCSFYFTLPFGQMHARNPAIVALAKALGRTPASIAMKLVNFASLDPAHRSRGVIGLTGTSRADREIWEQFATNLGELAIESASAMSRFALKLGPEDPRQRLLPEFVFPPAGRQTERESTTVIRTKQSFFRRLILAAYDLRCCVTGNPIPDLLIASHILPWSTFPEHRLNPHNGLCLAAHFDRAFDAGLITFGEDMRLNLGAAIRSHLEDRAIAREFISMEGAQLKISERFPPNPEFLAYHRKTIFKG
jgi:predicted restriction endonuclease